MYGLDILIYVFYLMASCPCLGSKLEYVHYIGNYQSAEGGLIVYNFLSTHELSVTCKRKRKGAYIYNLGNIY